MLFFKLLESSDTFFSFLVILIFILNPDLLFIGSYPQGSPAHPATFPVM